MELIEIAPPGTWCQTAAFLEILDEKKPGNTFLEIGCGDGRLAEVLCRKSYRGIGYEPSPDANPIARERLKDQIEQGRFQLHKAVFETTTESPKVDFAFSMMVLEHVRDDLALLRKMVQPVKSGGLVIVGVPGRKDRWTLEDEKVGHFRRYEREELAQLLKNAGLTDVSVRSVSVPIANWLFWPGRLLYHLSARRLPTSDLRQTQLSGVQAIPFKTVFPWFFRYLLNRVTLYPFFVVQRFFYDSRLGLTLIGYGRVK